MGNDLLHNIDVDESADFKKPTDTNPRLYEAVFLKYFDLGGEAGFLGASVSGLKNSFSHGGRYAEFENGVIYWTEKTGAHEVHGDILKKWTALGRELGILGYPVTDERTCGDGSGRYSQFQNGCIYWHPKVGAYEVHGDILALWNQSGAVKGGLGYPITDEMPSKDGVGRYSDFQFGCIYWSPETGSVRLSGGHPRMEEVEYRPLISQWWWRKSEKSNFTMVMLTKGTAPPDFPEGQCRVGDINIKDDPTGPGFMYTWHMFRTLITFDSLKLDPNCSIAKAELWIRHFSSVEKIGSIATQGSRSAARTMHVLTAKPVYTATGALDHNQPARFYSELPDSEVAGTAGLASYQGTLLGYKPKPAGLAVDMTELCRSWAKGTEEKHGLMMIGTDEGCHKNDDDFFSDYGDVTLRMKVIQSYAVRTRPNHNEVH